MRIFVSQMCGKYNQLKMIWQYADVASDVFVLAVHEDKDKNS